MVIGESSSGKSTIINCLQKAMCRLHPPFQNQKVIANFINPKSVTIHQLYGIFEVETKNWIEGILSKIMRDQAANLDLNTRKWIIFDGPVDASKKYHIKIF